MGRPAEDLELAIHLGVDIEQLHFMLGEISGVVMLSLEELGFGHGEERFKANDATYRILKLSNKISDLNEVELDSLFAQIVTRPTFNGQLGTLQLLISTGKINLLKNQELKSRLITWPGLIDDVKEEEIYANFIFDNAILEGLSQYAVLPEILENVSARKSLVNESQVMTPYEINHQVMKSQYEKLLSDQYFLNQLISRNINFQISYSESHTLIHQANDIKALIKKDLTK